MIIKLLDKNDNQLYFHFNNLLEQKELDKIKNYKVTDKTTEITVRWYDSYNTKKYNQSMSLITILKKGIKQIEKIIKEDEDTSNFKKKLNCCGLSSITKNKNKIKIEAQFS